MASISFYQDADMTKKLFDMNWTEILIWMTFDGFSNIGNFDPSYGNTIYVSNDSYDNTITLELLTVDNENITSLSVAPNTPITLSESAINEISSFANIIVKYSSTSITLPVYIIAGSSVGEVKVEMSCDTPDAIIRYTTNNQNPTEQDAQYVSPITISESKIIKARGFKDGMLASDIAELEVTVESFRELVEPDIRITRISYDSECLVEIFNPSYYPSDAKIIINDQSYNIVEEQYIDIGLELDNVSVYASYDGDENFENHSDYLDIPVPEVDSMQVWTSIDAFDYGNNIDVECIYYGNGKFLAIAHIQVLSSTDGINWSEPSDTNISYPSSICYGGGKFIIGGDDSLAYSTNGINWNVISGLGFDEGYSPILHSMCYGNGIFVAVGDDRKASYSTDGINWIPMVDIKFGNVSANSICYGNGKFVAVGDDKKGAYCVY